MSLLRELGWYDQDLVIRWCVRWALVCYAFALGCLLTMVVLAILSALGAVG